MKVSLSFLCSDDSTGDTTFDLIQGDISAIPNRYQAHVVLAFERESARTAHVIYRIKTASQEELTSFLTNKIFRCVYPIKIAMFGSLLGI